MTPAGQAGGVDWPARWLRPRLEGLKPATPGTGGFDGYTVDEDGDDLTI